VRKLNGKKGRPTREGVSSIQGGQKGVHFLGVNGWVEAGGWSGIEREGAGFAGSKTGMRWRPEDARMSSGRRQGE